MPYFTNEYGAKIEYASEADLLDFANKARAAGGANALGAFFPSIPGEAESCLIANALNFGCEISDDGALDGGKDGEHQWFMNLPSNMEPEKQEAIANALECELDADHVFDSRIKLPRLIGNTAHAFDDAKRGWVVKYRDKES